MDDAGNEHRPMSGVPSAGPDIEVTILMPCLNEAETLSNCLDEARAMYHEKLDLDGGSAARSRS